MKKITDPIAESLKGAKSETLAVRAGQVRTQADEHSEALFLTSSYVFDSCEDAAASPDQHQAARQKRPHRLAAC